MGITHRTSHSRRTHGPAKLFGSPQMLGLPQSLGSGLVRAIGIAGAIATMPVDSKHTAMRDIYLPFAGHAQGLMKQRKARGTLQPLLTDKLGIELP